MLIAQLLDGAYDERASCGRLSVQVSYAMQFRASGYRDACHGRRGDTSSDQGEGNGFSLVRVARPLLDVEE